MKEIDRRILAYFKLKGQGTEYEISLNFLDTYLILKHKEKHYIGGELIKKMEEMISGGLVSRMPGNKLALTPKGISKL